MRMSTRVTLSLAAVLIASVPVLSVTNGSPDSTLHPYVGIAVQPIAGGLAICSGTALSATKVLTAAHCFDPARFVFVAYQPGPLFSFVPGIFHPNPDWCQDCGPGLQGSVTHDVGVITLLAPANAGPYATLPSVGFVDTLPMRTPVDVVGYGVQGFLRGEGPPTGIFIALRFFAPTLLIQSNNLASPEFIKLTANPAQDKGGVCFGDSGSPALLGDTNIVLAVNDFVTNDNCTGVTYATRVDRTDILTFINTY